MPTLPRSTAEARSDDSSAVLADTSGLYAILDADDGRHSMATKAWVQLLESGRTIFLHDFVFLEVWTLLQARLGVEAVSVFHRDYLPLLSGLRVSEDLLSRGVARCLGAARRDLSLTDCVSFELARDHGITRALALDRHFTEAGFIVPGDRGWLE